MAEAPFNLDAVRAFSFDCYGTLIDWEGGIRCAMQAVPGLGRVDAEASDLVVSDGDARRFAATLPDWPPHSDAGPFLQ